MVRLVQMSPRNEGEGRGGQARRPAQEVGGGERQG